MPLLTPPRCFGPNIKARNVLLVACLPAVLGLAFGGCGTSLTSSPAATQGAPLSPLVDPTPKLADELIVQIRSGADPEGVWAEYHLGAQQVLADGRTYRTSVLDGTDPHDVLNQMQGDVRVVDAEMNVPVGTPVLKQSTMVFNEGTLSTEEFFDQSLAERLGLDLAHEGSKGKGVIVAVLDTGVDPDHPALSERIHSASRDFVENDAYADDLPDGVDNDQDGLVDEATGHGTHVAGLVALVAPSAQILVLRVLNSDGQGNAYQVANAIDYAVNNGAHVINMSIRLTSVSVTLDRAIRGAADHGVIMVVAAGNNGVFGPLDYPASDPRLWAVAALDTYNHPASFTSSSESVAISAPGENILSTYWNGGYAIWSGTSMAAPIVSGTAALVIAQNSGLTGGEILNRLKDSALSIPGDPPGLGDGMVNPGGAVGDGDIPETPVSESGAAHVLTR